MGRFFHAEGDGRITGALPQMIAQDGFLEWTAAVERPTPDFSILTELANDWTIQSVDGRLTPADWADSA
jgi:hypothetical protein